MNFQFIPENAFPYLTFSLTQDKKNPSEVATPKSSYTGRIFDRPPSPAGYQGGLHGTDDCIHAVAEQCSESVQMQLKHFKLNAN